MFQELIDNLSNVSVFTESIGEWVSNLSINSVIIFIMMIFMIVGAIDKMRGNKLGYGEQFDEGLPLSLDPSLSPSIPQSVRIPQCLQPPFCPATWAAIPLQCSWQRTSPSVTLRA